MYFGTYRIEYLEPEEIRVNESLNPIVRREIQQQAREILSRCTQIEKDYMNKNLSYFSAKEELRHLESLNQRYKQEAIQFTKLVAGVIDHYKMASQRRKKRTLKAEQQANNLVDELPAFDETKQYFQPKEKWADDKFDEFVMKCSSKDQFDRHSQVYFCYGRLSNRSLLMRYGMTLEFNKYDHVFMRVPYLNQLSDLMKTKVKPYSYNVSQFKKFKIRRYDFNLEILAFCRVKYFSLPESTVNSIFYGTNLKREVQVMDDAIALYKQYLAENFNHSLEENEKSLFDTKIGYHEYFSVVYRLERQRIMMTQITLCEVAKELIKRMIAIDTESYAEICEEIVSGIEVSEKQKNHFRYLLNPYFKRMKLNDEREQKEFLLQHRAKIEKNDEAERNRERHAAKASVVKQPAGEQQQEIERKAAELVQQSQKQQAELLEKVREDAKKIIVNTYKYSVRQEEPTKVSEARTNNVEGNPVNSQASTQTAEQKKNQEERVLRSFNMKTKSLIPSVPKPSFSIGQPPQQQPSKDTRVFAQTTSMTDVSSLARNPLSTTTLRPPSFAELAKKHSVNQEDLYAPVSIGQRTHHGFGGANRKTESASRSPEERLLPKPIMPPIRRTSQLQSMMAGGATTAGSNTSNPLKKPPVRLPLQKLNSLPSKQI